MAYGFRSVFWVNLYVAWFVCDCVMVKDQFHGVLGPSETKHCVSGQQNPEHNGKWGCAQISAHLCESAALSHPEFHRCDLCYYFTTLFFFTT